MNDEKEEELRSTLDEFDTFLDQRDFLVGNCLTLADISIYASINIMEVLDWEFAGWMNIYEWYKRVKQELPFDKEISSPVIECLRRRLVAKRVIKPRDYVSIDLSVAINDDEEDGTNLINGQLKYDDAEYFLHLSELIYELFCNVNANESYH